MNRYKLNRKMYEKKKKKGNINMTKVVTVGAVRKREREKMWLLILKTDTTSGLQENCHRASG